MWIRSNPSTGKDSPGKRIIRALQFLWSSGYGHFIPQHTYACGSTMLVSSAHLAPIREPSTFRVFRQPRQRLWLSGALQPNVILKECERVSVPFHQFIRHFVSDLYIVSQFLAPSIVDIEFSASPLHFLERALKSLEFEIICAYVQKVRANLVSHSRCLSTDLLYTYNQGISANGQLPTPSISV